MREFGIIRYVILTSIVTLIGCSPPIEVEVVPESTPGTISRNSGQNDRLLITVTDKNMFVIDAKEFSESELIDYLKMTRDKDVILFLKHQSLSEYAYLISNKIENTGNRKVTLVWSK